ncbi:MAG: hypothetical protein KatS3mg034_0638 [Vicingaceae bacterium]|nr:MAG: hypothetical protein KatS3mg034_0638 [Vicingaceae bacterium]
MNFKQLKLKKRFLLLYFFFLYHSLINGIIFTKIGMHYIRKILSKVLIDYIIVKFYEGKMNECI